MNRASHASVFRQHTRAIGLFSTAVLLAACASSREPASARRETQPPSQGVVRAAEIPQQPAAAQPQQPDQHTFAFPTGERGSSTILLERLTPDEVRLNKPYEYQIRVTNLTDQPINDVVVREQTPESLQITKAEPTTRPAEGGYHEYQIGELGPNESRTITVSGVPSQQGPLSTCMTVSYTPTLCVTTDVVNPIIRLSLAGPDQALLCDTLEYRYSVRNEGTGTERDVQIVDQLPEGLTTLQGENRVAINFGDVSAGQVVERTVSLKAQRTGEFSRQIVTNIGDEEIKSEQLTTVVQKPSLAVEIQGPETAYIGRPVTYQVTIRNTGDVPARDLAMNLEGPGRAEVAAIIDGQPKLLSIQPEPTRQQPRRSEQQQPTRQRDFQAPESENGRYHSAPGPGTPEVNLIPTPRERGIEGQPPRLSTQGEEARVTAVGPSGEINLAQQGIGPLAPGESQTFNVTVPNPEAGVLKLTAAANAYCADRAIDTAETNIRVLSALLLTAVDQSDPIQVGNDVVYNITVRNQGSGPDQNVRITATLPEGISFVRATGPTQPQVEGQRLNFAPINTLAGGQTVTWQVVGRAQNPGDVRFRVELNSQNLTSGPANVEEPTQLY